MFDPAKVGEEIFSILRTFNYNVKLYDEESNETTEPAEARRFWTDRQNIVVSVFEDGENSTLHVYLGRSVDIQSVQGMLDSLRKQATESGLTYGIRKYNRELTPKDFVNGGKVLESRKLTGSTKSSYLKLEGAKMILRHDSAIDEKKHGARARNVRKVFVENSDGERFLMPTQNLMAGRAMTRHVSKDGQFHDDIGTKITEMATEQQQMKTCASYCRKNKKLGEDVSMIVEACTQRAKNIRNILEGLYRRYDKSIGELEKQNDDMLLETDDELMEERVAALKKKLQLEDESVVDRPTCENVVRVMEGRPKSVEMITLPALDCEVEREPWQDFIKNASIAFVGSVAPDLSSANNLSNALSLIAKNTDADGLANMFARVSQDLENGKTDILLQQIAKKAVNIAKSNPAPAAEPRREAVAEGLSKGLPIVNESVRELEAWFESMSAENVFEDDWGSRYPTSNPSDEQYGNDLDSSISTVESEFNVDDFLVMSGDDFNYGDSTLSDDEKTVDASDLLSSLKHYMTGEVGDEFSARVDGDNEVGDLTDMAKRVLPQVVSKLEQTGYTVTGQDALETDDDGEALDADDDIKFDDRMLESDDDAEWDAHMEKLGREARRAGKPVKPSGGKTDAERSAWRRGWHGSKVDEADGVEDNKEVLLGGEELSSEDVVINSNPASDMVDDVTADHEEGEEDSTDYINRLLSLAGRKTMMAPRAPQP